MSTQQEHPQLPTEIGSSLNEHEFADDVFVASALTFELSDTEELSAPPAARPASTTSGLTAAPGAAVQTSQRPQSAPPIYRHPSLINTNNSAFVFLAGESDDTLLVQGVPCDRNRRPPAIDAIRRRLTEYEIVSPRTVAKAEAEEIKTKLEEAGATVEVK